MKARTGTFTVRLKMGLSIAGIFLLVMAGLMEYSYLSDRSKNLDLAVTQVKGMNNFYFDSLNTLMQADEGMEERDLLRDKMLELPGVVDVRVLRGKEIMRQYGEGRAYERVEDDLDRRALAGESILTIEEKDGARLITVLEPYLMSENTRGTDCLECHRRAKSGDVGGAVRLTYSLKSTDELFVAGLWHKFGITSVFFALGIAVLMWLMNRLVVIPVNRMKERLKDIATGEGDLTQTLEQTSADEFGELANWFNQFVSKLRGLVGDISQYAGQLTDASEDMNNVIHQIGASTAEQQSKTDQVAHAMQEMNTMVQMVYANAVDASSGAAESKERAGEGSAVIGDTIRTIGGLAEAVEKAESVVQQVSDESNNITVVLDVIRGIAEQTNLLALNAAIEAARAGEQGRGFAVVADEVRTLAERTQQSTQEIQKMIESLQQGVSGAVEVMVHGKEQATLSVEQVGKAGESLNAITTSIESISSKNRQIAETAEAHRAVSDDINNSVSEISEMAGHTASETQEMTNASERLAQMAEDLKKMLDQFKV